MKLNPRFLVIPALVAGLQAASAADVTGKITLNGKPLANATVTFSPIAKPGEVNAGDGSAGTTDGSGHYTLTTSRGAQGAQVGSHRVRISVLSQQVGDSDQRRPRGGWPLQDQIPVRYNGETKLTFDVTAGGPNTADFDLTSP